MITVHSHIKVFHTENNLCFLLMAQVRALYGDPYVDALAWSTALAVMCLHAPLSYFLHPAVVKVIQVKWNLFAWRMFMMTEIWYMVNLLFFMIGFIAYGTSCDMAWMRVASGVISAITFLLQLSVVVRQFRAGQVRKQKGAFVLASLPCWLRNPWNANRMLAMFLIIIAACSDRCRSMAERAAGGLDFEDVILAIAGAMLWLGMLQVLTLSTRLSAFCYSIGILASDMGRSFIVIAVLLLGFSSGIVMVERTSPTSDGSFESLGGGVMNLIQILINMSSPALENSETFTAVALVLFACLANVGMLNILIAQLSLSFETIARDTPAFAMAHRAQLCIEMCDQLTKTQRRRYFDSLHFERYVEFDRGDIGVPGGIEALESVWSVRADPRFVQDRIRRYTGEADQDSPWPEEDADQDHPTALGVK